MGCFWSSPQNRPPAPHLQTERLTRFYRARVLLCHTDFMDRVPIDKSYPSLSGVIYFLCCFFVADGGV